MSSHPLDNIKIDEEFRAESAQLGAKHGIVGHDKMMGDKAGMFNDSKLVSFGAAREKAMQRMGDKLVPYSIYSECVKGNQGEVRAMLCEERIQIDERNPFNGRTLLHECAAKGHLNMATMLLEDFGANINCRTYLGGETPLHLAVSQNLRSMVFMLLNYGADANIKSKYMATPLHYVQKKSIAALICRAGGKTFAKDIHGHAPVTSVINELDEGKGKDELVDFLQHVNIDQDREKYKQEREANKAQREEIERLKKDALSRKNKGAKMSFKEKMKKEYDKWRKGDKDFNNEVERRARLKREKPDEYFEDEDWRMRPPADHDPAAGERKSKAQNWIR
ncbi:hypothetical protein TrRE_jg1346 [Triparma retinervis]|uniref:Uncharacterized protein n=1 Tax=Triparma retinervis TaxID=2557542 RepID=A0A9W7FCK4_9STRA|nr:hypothetical protein TrRE_jg1346 [Triparma retinervis]